jgi:hypothetical protein
MLEFLKEKVPVRYRYALLVGNYRIPVQLLLVNV